MPAVGLDQAPNLNHVWAGLLVEELVRCGVTLFVLAPGSRSTPLTTAAARHPRAETLLHVDERGAAFAALGYGRAAGRPAAWITTSGTAVANGLPAAVEAATDRVPLLFLTADRPPELRETGANQTIDQVKIFGEYVRWQFDLPAPTTEIDPQMVLTTADQAVYRARRAPAGPVHLNCMYRKPLAPEDDGTEYNVYLSGLSAWQENGSPHTSYTPTTLEPGEEAIQRIAEQVAGIERGLVVAGRLDTAAEAHQVARLATRLGWPLLPDITSRLRLGPAGEASTRMPYADQVLVSTAFREAMRPAAVLHLGGRFVSKRLQQFLAASDLSLHLVAAPSPDRFDPAHGVTHRFEANVGPFCERLADRLDALEMQQDAHWLDRWQAAGARIDAALEAAAAETERLSEPFAARLVSEHLPEGHGLCLASSMPVRDMNRYAASSGPAVPAIANRGASGIDGTVATAAGMARGRKAPVTLLIGDLALLHDLNALALLRQVPVVVVVINNDGGGIFSFLPIARHEDVFEPYFGTPHGRSFASAAAFYDLPYFAPETPAAFVEAYRTACAAGGSAIVEVRTDRTENHALHQRLEARLAAAVEDVL